MDYDLGSSTELFVYNPLPTRTSVRLLRRIARDEDGLLQFSIETVDLNDGPKYHCLSYTWGNPHADGTLFQDAYAAVDAEYGPDKTIPIRCNGKIFRVRRNLYDALCEIPADVWLKRINRQNPENGQIFLHQAATDGKVDLIRSQIRQGADIHAKDDRSRIPLHYAAQNGHLEAVKVLIAGGSRAAVRDSQGKTPSECAHDNKHKHITEYLQQFLDGKTSEEAISLWKDSPDSLIWIDAICINQKDVRERGAQVSIMDLIYRKAWFVLVWLGRKDNYTERAINTVEKLSTSTQKLSRTDIKPFTSRPQEDYERAGVPYISQEDWDALAALLMRQWYRRIWVIQEVTFASDIIVYCGQQEVRWRDLNIMIAFFLLRSRAFGNSASDKYIPLDAIATSAEYYLSELCQFKYQAQEGTKEHRAQRFSCIQLINSTAPFMATDPRDKVFALYSLLTLDPDTRSHWVPEYSQSVAACYANLTKELAESIQNLRILSFVQDISIKKINTLPSWVPDLSLQGFMPLPGEGFNASNSSAHSFSQSDLSWDALGVTGVEFDIVERAANTRTVGGLYRKFHLDPSWFELLLQMDKDYHNNQSRTEVLWRTLCADKDMHRTHPAPNDLGEMFKTMVCAMICIEADQQYQAEFKEKVRDMVLVKLLEAVAAAEQAPSSEPYILGEEDLRAIYSEVEIQMEERHLASPLFDKVRPTLENLRLIASTDTNPCTPTPEDIESYLQERLEPLIVAGGGAQIPPAFSPFALAHDRVYGGRRLFLTRKKYLGLGPISLQEGDAVFVLSGAISPFVLRSMTSSGGGPRRFNLVGEAYVHGIMHGEAFNLDGESGTRLEEIVLV